MEDPPGPVPKPGARDGILPVSKRGCEDVVVIVAKAGAEVVALARVGEALEGEPAAGAAGEGRPGDRATTQTQHTITCYTL